MKSVAILGAGGYIGSYLTKKLSKKFKLKILVHHAREAKRFKGLRHITSFSGDVLSRGDLEQVIQKGDIVVNLSGTTTLDQREKDHFDVNLTGQYIVADVCAKRSARLIFFSTAHIYSSKNISSRESDTVQPQDAYSFSKKLAEEIYEYYCRTHHLSATILRVGSVYGPEHKKGVVYNMAQSIKNIGVIEIPRQKVSRDMIYIDDAVNAVAKAISYSKKGFHVFNISSGKEESLAHVAEKICRISHKGSIKRVNKKTVPATIHMNIRKAIRELKFKPKIGLETGLRRTLSSYKL